MQIRGIRLKIVIIVFGVVLSLALIGQHFGHQKFVVDPLQRLFSQVEGVNQVVVDESDGKIRLTISFDRSKELHLTLQEILDLVNRHKGDFEILIKDNPNQHLENTEYLLHFAIQEALQTGNFTAMANTIGQVATNNNVDYRIDVNQKYLLLQLYDGDNYLYKVTSRDDNDIFLRYYEHLGVS